MASSSSEAEQRPNGEPEADAHMEQEEGEEELVTSDKNDVPGSKRGLIDDDEVMAKGISKMSMNCATEGEEEEQ